MIVLSSGWWRFSSHGGDLGSGCFHIFPADKVLEQRDALIIVVSEVIIQHDPCLDGIQLDGLDRLQENKDLAALSQIRHKPVSLEPFDDIVLLQHMHRELVKGEVPTLSIVVHLCQALLSLRCHVV